MRNRKPLRICRTELADGFSLIELLIVVAIILIIAAIAVPNLIRAKIAANQSSAVENCRTITSAEINYYIVYGGFAKSLNALGGPAVGAPSAANAQMIDDALSSGLRSGYQFSYVALNADVNGKFQDYFLNADPQAPGFSGVNHYFTNEPSVIHFSSAGKASVNDPPIQ
jgi:prepilin-type N-terminal cleavage/methylation domain-containing protein